MLKFEIHWLLKVWSTDHHRWITCKLVRNAKISGLTPDLLNQTAI